MMGNPKRSKNNHISDCREAPSDDREVNKKCIRRYIYICSDTPQKQKNHIPRAVAVSSVSIGRLKRELFGAAHSRSLSHLAVQ